MSKNRKNTAAAATLVEPVFWKIETVMHSPISAMQAPERPNTAGLLSSEEGVYGPDLLTQELDTADLVDNEGIDYVSEWTH